MKTISALFLAFALTGCAIVPTQHAVTVYQPEIVYTPSVVYVPQPLIYYRPFVQPHRHSRPGW
jgi:hypothetical protein